MKRFTVVSTIFVMGLLVYVRQAQADVGPPPIFSQGGSLQTNAGATQVVMESETVELRYAEPRTSTLTSYPETILPVHVTATFVMNNTGTAPENLEVFFPSNDSTFVGGWGGDETHLTNFYVNGITLGDSALTNISTLINGSSERIHVFQWKQLFPAGQRTTLNIEYDSQSGKDYSVYYLTYVLGTGRGWKGPIGQGTIRFILPRALASYSVVDEPPLIGKNPLPYTVDGQTITVSFTNYEPETDTTLRFGVADPDIVDRIEALKNKTANFTNLLTIAGGYWQLSYGPHCTFCVGSAANLAETAFLAALDKASTKAQVNETLAAFMSGTSSFNDWAKNAPDPLTLFRFSDCKKGDADCRYSQYYERGYFGDTPFHIYYATRQVEHLDFLQAYVDKMRPYDAGSADLVAKFIADTPAAIAWYNKTYPPETNINTAQNDNGNSNTNKAVVSNTNVVEAVAQPNNTSTSKTATSSSSNKDEIIASALIALVALAGALALVVRNRVRQVSEKKL